ncbi:MAG: SDR family NAD(P)-dependent oxidoreductase [Deltaproteobacteria bacterium]|jgi:benzil reductase ((S)-benzoin forming)|nr:SDR family NAD(P)-dependent oxidoreductase [Deltaproteobacteria bacterium]
MDVFIVSGGSKGLGAALVKKCLSMKKTVFSLSRTHGDGFFIQCDLSKPEDIDKVFLKISHKIEESLVSSITLINNAAVIEPIGPVTEFEMSQIVYNINVNFTGTILLSRHYMKYIQDFEIPKKIINISSGAALDPYGGWSLYCAAKAGIEHFVRSVALEQQLKLFPVSILNISPGIMDTDMQKIIRKTKVDKFPLVDLFRKFKKNRDLQPPDKVAQLIIDAICFKTFASGSTVALADL